MIWTEDKPTVPGWYWWRRNDYPVTMFLVTSQSLTRMDEWVDCEWAGPIPEPEERA